MRRGRFQSSLLPPGLSVEQVQINDREIVAVARPQATAARCPSCGGFSERVHSRYERCLADLPAHGRRVRIRLTVRRFRCPEPGCPRQIFAERFGEAIARPFARRTARMQDIVHHLGLALGGRPRTIPGTEAPYPGQQRHAAADRARSVVAGLRPAAGGRDR